VAAHLDKSGNPRPQKFVIVNHQNNSHNGA
jgi:hypothetical protein